MNLDSFKPATIPAGVEDEQDSRLDKQPSMQRGETHASAEADRIVFLTKISSLSSDKVMLRARPGRSGSFNQDQGQNPDRRLSPQVSWDRSHDSIFRRDKSSSEVSEARKSGRQAANDTPASKILHATFGGVGILVFQRILVIWLVVALIIINVCPGSNDSASFCGDPKFFGIYYEYPSISLISLSFLGVVFLAIIYQSSDHWISTIQKIKSQSVVKYFLKCVYFFTKTFQPNEDQKPDTDLIWRPIAALLYTLICIPLFVVSELTLLIQYPLELGRDRFYSDYEIFRSVLVGTIVAVVSMVCAISAIGINSLSPVGIALLVSAFFQLCQTVLFLWRFARDDESNFIVSFITNCSLASHVSHLLPPDDVSKDTLSEVGECPFYRTMRYREKIDFRQLGEMREFQIVQLLRNLKLNPVTSHLFFSPSNKLPVRIGRLVATQLKQPDMLVEFLNEIRIHAPGERVIYTPDVSRTRTMLSTLRSHALVPWNTREIHWREGLPWAKKLTIPAADSTLFPFSAAVAIGVTNPEILLELDLGSNMIGDELADDLAQLIDRSKKLVYLELGLNQFTKKGMGQIVQSIINHPSLEFVRLSTVLFSVISLKADSFLDLSLPTMYQQAVNRCVDSLYDCCQQFPDLVGSTLDSPPRLPPKVLDYYLGRIREVGATQFRLAGRELYRSVPPEVASKCVQRVAHRLGKYEIADPHDLLELPGNRCLDASVVKMKELVDSRLYLSFLHPEFDIMLISKIIETHNENIEELDMRGMQLNGDSFKMLLQALVPKKRLKSITFTNCGIQDTHCVSDLIKFIIDSSETLMEVNLLGNRGFNGKKNEIWSAISQSEKVNTPRIMVDNTL